MTRIRLTDDKVIVTVDQYADLPMSDNKVGNTAWVKFETGNSDEAGFKPNGLYVWDGSVWETDTDSPTAEVITESDVIDSKSSDEATKPSSARKLKEVNDDLQTHKNNEENPHNITPAQVGRDTAQWNANRIKGVTVIDTNKGDNTLLVHLPSGEFVYIEKSSLVDSVLSGDGDIDVTRDAQTGVITISYTGTTAGEVNTAENVGVSGVGLFKEKLAEVLKFRKIRSLASGILSIVENGDTIDIDINPTNINHNTLSNYSADEHRIINDTGESATELWSASKIKGITDGKIESSEKGASNGVATLDGNGTVPASQLPSYVDDVHEYDTYALLPATGEAGKIYITLDNNNRYRWGGNNWVLLNDGEANTASNEGTEGVGVFKEKSAVNFVFKNLVGKDQVVVTENVTNGTIEISVPDLAETITTVVDNGDGSFTYTNEDGEAITIENWDYVTQQEAETGTSTTMKSWSPERVKQAIEALSGGDFAGLLHGSTEKTTFDDDDEFAILDSTGIAPNNFLLKKFKWSSLVSALAGWTIGAWDSTKTYVQNDLVSYEGAIYKNSIVSNTNINPTTLARSGSSFAGGGHLRTYATLFSNAYLSDVQWNHDGTRNYSARGTDNIAYATCSTPYDIRTAPSYVNFDWDATTVEKFQFGDDFNKFYTLMLNTNTIREYDLTVRGEPESGKTYVQSFALSATYEGSNGFQFSLDGTKLVTKYSTAIRTYNLSTAWDISTAVLSSSGTVSGGIGFALNDCGTKMFIINDTIVYEHNLIVPFEASSASAVLATVHSFVIDAGNGICINPDNSFTTGSEDRWNHHSFAVPYNMCSKWQKITS